MTLEGRAALVTGGGRGIGRAISIALAEDGADVVVNYRRDQEAAEEAVIEIEKMGRRAVAVQGSVDSLDDVRRVAEEATDALGAIDILVHNAGIASRGNTVAKTEPDELDRVMRTHALGPFWLTNLLLPKMRTKPRGDIVFISSNTTRLKGMPAGAPYHMGKHAMEALAFSLAKEERGKGIHVNIVAPGLVKTEMGRRLMTAWGQDIDAMDESSTYGRVCRPEDIANVVRWLVSDGAGYVNGERIYVDGGAQ